MWNTIPPLAHGADQNNQVCGILCDHRQISRKIEAKYTLLSSNKKKLGLLFGILDCYLFNVRMIYIEMICYRKYPFDTGIKVWLVDVKESLATQISGTIYPNDKLDQSDFLCSCHG